MKRVYLLMTVLLIMGMTGCGKETPETEMTTQGLVTESTTQEQTEETVTEVATQEETEITTQENTEATTEAVTEEVTEQNGAEVSTEIAPEEQTGGNLTPDQALELIEKTLGTEDEETGNTYAFTHVNTMTVNGVEYHVFMWGWLVDGHVSKLTDLFVATDGSAIHEGFFVGDGATVYTETNFLEQ
ncbi:MAG: hypothetical protein IJP29_05740 [Lachnospiraceae bacterium]|nr:hypothetical protein [Lachnospiraceae bacterium]